MEHPLKADILVDIGPVNAVAPTDESEVLALLGSGVGEPPRPGKGHSDGATIAQASNDFVLGHVDGASDGVGVSRSVGARHLGFPSWHVRRSPWLRLSSLRKVSYRKAEGQGSVRCHVEVRSE